MSFLSVNYMSQCLLARSNGVIFNRPSTLYWCKNCTRLLLFLSPFLAPPLPLFLLVRNMYTWKSERLSLLRSIQFSFKRIIQCNAFLQSRLEKKWNRSAVERRLGRTENGAHKKQQQQNVEKFMYVLARVYLFLLLFASVLFLFFCLMLQLWDNMHVCVCGISSQ